MASGGYRKPASPAPVSGPGSLSRRTDGGPAQVQSVPTGMDYGDHQALHAQEQTAPMAGTPNIPTLDLNTGAAPAGPPPPPVTPIGAPSQRPNEPITHGVDIGPGGGSEVLPMEHQDATFQPGPMSQMLAQLSARDTTGSLATLYQYASALGV